MLLGRLKQVTIVAERHDLDAQIHYIVDELNLKLESGGYIAVGLEYFPNILPRLEELANPFDEEGFIRDKTEKNDNTNRDSLRDLLNYTKAIRKRYLEISSQFIEQDGKVCAVIINKQGEIKYWDETISGYLQYTISVKLLEKLYSLKRKHGARLGIQLLSHDLNQEVLKHLDDRERKIEDGVPSEVEEYPERRYRTLMMTKNILQGLKRYRNYVVSTGAVHGYYIHNMIYEFAKINHEYIHLTIIDASGAASVESPPAILEYWNEKMDELQNDLIIAKVLAETFKIQWPQPYYSLMNDRLGLYRERKPLSLEDKNIILEELEGKINLSKMEKDIFIKLGFRQYEVDHSLVEFWKDRVWCGSIGHKGKKTTLCKSFLQNGVIAKLTKNPKLGL